jgi:endoglucanase
MRPRVPVLLVAALCALGVAAPAFAQGGEDDQPLSLVVVGNHLLHGMGRPVRLAGIVRPGTDTLCVQGQGIFDGPTDDASVRAIASWPVNAVRIPLAEDCWLGTDGAPAADSGPAYRAAIADYVRTLHRNGLFAELALAGRQPMPDAAHAPDFWRSLAAAFKDDPAVFFGLYAAPHDVSWACWRAGGTACSTGYPAAGMQQLVDVVRSTGAEQPIAVSGIGSGNDLTGWLRAEPSDDDHRLLAEFHVANGSACGDVSCWSRTLLPVARKVPVVTGELAEADCRSVFIDGFLPFARAHGIAYLASAWSPAAGCSALITSYQGTPSALGFVYREHLAAAALPPSPPSAAPPPPHAALLGGPLGIGLTMAGAALLALLLVAIVRRRRATASHS